MADFIHDLAKSWSILSAQLKKDAPSWNQKCTKIVKELKQISKTLSSLKIPPNGKIILHTDASDCYLGDVLLEEMKKRNHTFTATRVEFSKKVSNTTIPRTKKFLQ